MSSESLLTERTWSEIMRPFWRMVEFDGREITILLIYTLALGFISSVVPFASQVLVNQAAFTGAAPPIVALATIVLGVLLTGAFIRLFQIRVTALIAKRIFVRTALKGTQSLLEHPSGAYEFDDREVANRFFDVISFQSNFATLVSEALGVFVFSIIGIVILALYHTIFFASSLLLLLLCVIVITVVAKRGLQLSYERSIQKYRMAYWISQVAENRSLLRQTKANRIVQERTDNLAVEYVRSYFNYLRNLLWQSGALFFIQAFGSSAFFGIGGWLVVRGQLNLGQLVAAEIVLLSNMTALTRFYFYLDSFYKAVVAAMKIGELTEIEGAPLLSSSAMPSVNVRSISLNTPLLENASSIKPGEFIILRGTSRGICSELLRDLAANERKDNTYISWDCDPPMDPLNNGELLLYLARPAVLRMTLAENLSLLSDADTMDEALQSVANLPLLSPSERSRLETTLHNEDMSISSRARYAACRVFMSRRPVVLMDMFFNLMETEDQITFVNEFRRRFPERILIIHSFDKVVDSLADRIIEVEAKTK